MARTFMLLFAFTTLLGCGSDELVQVPVHDDVPMSLIPAGEFLMGTDELELAGVMTWVLEHYPTASLEDQKSEIPQHTVYLDAFYLDVYEVTNPLDPHSEKERWEKAYREINLALEGQFPLDDRIREKGQRALNPKRYAGTRPREVRINNDVSDFFSVVEVRSAAIVGLLYKLAKKLFSLELNIRFAKFDRDEEYMSGDFYVRDSLGQKIYDEDRIDTIKHGIMTILK